MEVRWNPKLTDHILIFSMALCFKNWIHHSTMFQILVLIFKVRSTTRSLNSLRAVHVFKTGLHKAASKTKVTTLEGCKPFPKGFRVHKNFSELASLVLPGIHLDLTSLLRPVREHIGSPALPITLLLVFCAVPQSKWPTRNWAQNEELDHLHGTQTTNAQRSQKWVSNTRKATYLTAKDTSTATPGHLTFLTSGMLNQNMKVDRWFYKMRGPNISTGG